MSRTAGKTARTIAGAERACPPAAAGEIGDQPQLVAASVGTIAAGLIGRRPDLVRGGARILAAHIVATAATSAIRHAIDRSHPGTAGGDGRHGLSDMIVGGMRPTSTGSPDIYRRVTKTMR